MPRTLLLVEDDADTRRALASMFCRKGWDVRAAGTASEALAYLGGGPEPDYLLLDLQLPDGRGESILRKVRASGRKTNVVVCTGDPNATRLARCDELRPDMILFKPIDPDIVSNLCDGRTRPGCPCPWV